MKSDVSPLTPLAQRKRVSVYGTEDIGSNPIWGAMEKRKIKACLNWDNHMEPYPNDRHCPQCGAGYHCANCGGGTGMMGHYSSGEFSCEKMEVNLENDGAAHPQE
jgi:hypothetical protein